tara:strand:- start:161 stop:1261 length:1101 start_codon:yes stop_codon:yes gene_type:complete
MVFKKIYKGIKTGIKGIARGVKKAFKSFGKFMGKIGILGQVAMFFIMPYIGSALGNLWTGIAGQTASQALTSAQAAVQAGTATAAQQAMVVAGKGVATGLMKGGTLAQGVGKVMQFTANTVGKVGNAFNNVTKAVTDTLTNFGKTASNKIFGTTFDAADTFFTGGDSAFSRSFGEQSRIQNAFKDFDLFDSNGQLKKSVVDNFPDNPNPETVPVTDLSMTTSDIEKKLREDNLLSSVDKTSVEPEKGFFGTLRQGVSEIPEKVRSSAMDFAKDPLKPIAKFTEETLTSGLKSKALTELDLVTPPTYDVQNVSNVAYVPPLESFSGGPIQTPDIQIDSQFFQNNIMQNPNPWGYTAFQYGQYMAQRA